MLDPVTAPCPMSLCPGRTCACCFESSLRGNVYDGSQQKNNNRLLDSKHKNGHSSRHRATQKVSKVPIESISNSLSFGRVTTQFYEILPNTKTATARATGRPRRCQRYRSIAYRILYRLEGSRRNSTRVRIYIYIYIHIRTYHRHHGRHRRRY